MWFSWYLSWLASAEMHGSVSGCFKSNWGGWSFLFKHIFVLFFAPIVVLSFCDSSYGLVRPSLVIFSSVFISIPWDETISPMGFVGLWWFPLLSRLLFTIYSGFFFHFVYCTFWFWNLLSFVSIYVLQFPNCLLSKVMFSFNPSKYL